MNEIPILAHFFAPHLLNYPSITTGCIAACDPTCACSSGDIAIDTSLTTIANNAFYIGSITSVDFTGCSLLTTIGSFAFSDNSIGSLINLDGLSSLTTIGSYAFASNDITSVNFDGLSSLTTIGSVAFAFNSLGSYTLTHSLIYSLAYSPTPSLPHSLTPSLTHSLPHSLTYSFGKLYGFVIVDNY